MTSADFFQNQLFRKILSGIRLECQTVWKVGPDQGQNCLQKLSADDTGGLRVTLCICVEYQNLMNLPFCSI